MREMLHQDTTPRYYTRAELSLMRSAQWRELLASLGVAVANSLTEVPHSNQLFVTNCCGTKGVGIPHGTPDVFYLGTKQQQFYREMTANGFEWAILSDLYGMHFATESLPLYDLAPSQLTQEQLWDLGRLIRRKFLERYGGFPRVVYCKAPVSTAVPYIIMLLAAGCPLTLSLSCAHK